MKPCTTLVQEEANKWVYENAAIKVADLLDAKVLAPKLRQPDLDEIQAAVGIPPEESLYESIKLSREKYSVWSLDESEIYGTFGVVPVPKSKGGIVWFLGSDDLFDNSKVSFLRNSHFWVDKMMEKYEILFNSVDCRNTVHIRWLKWLGFTFTEVIEEFGYEKRPFRKFFKRKEE